MDSRHESLKEGTLNHIITIFNYYIQNNTELLIANTSLRNNIEEICNNIYRYVGMAADISGVLSKHNLLSTDIVMLPVITDPEANKILDEDDFAKLMMDVEKSVDKIESSSDDSLKQDLYRIIVEFKKEKDETMTFSPFTRR